MNRERVSFSEAARRLGVSRHRITRAVEKGGLKVMCKGRRRLVDPEEARAALDRLAAAGSGNGDTAVIDHLNRHIDRLEEEIRSLRDHSRRQQDKIEALFTGMLQLQSGRPLHQTEGADPQPGPVEDIRPGEPNRQGAGTGESIRQGASAGEPDDVDLKEMCEMIERRRGISRQAPGGGRRRRLFGFL